MIKTITVNWLNEIDACGDAVEAFKNQKETNPIKVVQGAMKIDRFDWANWLIVRLMNRKQNLQYAIFAAESVIDIYEKKYPDDNQPRNAIEAAKKVLGRDSKKNRIDAAAAAYAAACAVADAAAAADVACAAAAHAACAACAAYAAAAYAYARKKLQKKIINNGIKILSK